VIARFKDLCLDATDHQMLASWWCAVLGYQRRVEPDWERPGDLPVPIIDPTGAGPLIWIVPVPEPKTVKNRMHIDVFGDVSAIVAKGARVVLPRGDDRAWTVLVDPEGNEFCVFDPPD
jgi:glyoxalase superfamily protein